MIYQQSIVFNELSVNKINSEQIDSILNNFYELIFKLIHLSGKKLKNSDKNNLDRILFHEEFDRNFLISTNQFDDIERRRLKKLFSDFDMPSVPEYQFEGSECKGLGYACENNLLSISLYTDSKWVQTTLQIQKIENDEKLTTTPKKVQNISNIGNAFEILEKFAGNFYENCYSERMYFKADPKDTESKDFTHNLLPLKSISNPYVEYKQFYHENGKVKNVSETKKVAKIVGEINGWKICNAKGRVVYKHKNFTYYLSNDTKKGDFEIHKNTGEHLGAISFDCKKQEGVVKNRKITPC